MKKLVSFTIGLATASALASAALAQEITIGATFGATGPGASLGIHYKNAFQLMPKTLGGLPVKYIILEDGGDPTTAAKNARKLIAEDKVDALVGSVSVPSTTQVAVIATETKTPMIAVAPVALPPDKREWIFQVVQPIPLMMKPMVDQMIAKGVKTVGFIGYSDSWGDIVLNSTKKHSDPAGIKIVTEERYARADTSVAGQVIKILADNPDAVVVGGSGTGGALPHIGLVERGYAKQIYHNPGTANLEFIKVGGKAVEGAIATTGALLIPEDLPADHALKNVASDFVARYEQAFGAGSRNAFAGYSYDAYLILDKAVADAVKKAKPGTPEFRQALRDSVESVKDVFGTHAVYNMTPSDHTGVDDRARVMVQVKDGKWRLVK